MIPSTSNSAGSDVPIRELVVSLAEHVAGVANSPQENTQRHAAIRQTCHSLDSKGLDADSLVRHGMQSLIVSPLLAWIMLEGTLGATAGQRPFVDTDGWKHLIGDFAFSFSDDSQSLELSPEAAAKFSTASRMLALWVEEAPFSDLISRTPPTPEEFQRITNRPRPSVSPMQDTYTWIYQRMAITELDRWDDSSLHNELRLVLGLTPPPIPAEIMDIVVVEEEDLNRVVARRTISRTGDEILTPLLMPLQDEASRLLGQRRFREASALFEFYERQRPDDPAAVNNRGFCLIPVSPSEALHHLRSAEAMGYPAIAVSVYNMCCCYEDLGQHAKLIDRAESYWQREHDGAPSAATLWVRNGAEWDLYYESNVAAAIARIAFKSAQTLGLADRIPVWASRMG